MALYQQSIHGNTHLGIVIRVRLKRDVSLFGAKRLGDDAAPAQKSASESIEPDPSDPREPD
jgi:hypothetical protein